MNGKENVVMITVIVEALSGSWCSISSSSGGSNSRNRVVIVEIVIAVVVAAIVGVVVTVLVAVVIAVVVAVVWVIAVATATVAVKILIFTIMIRLFRKDFKVLVSSRNCYLYTSVTLDS